jgi:hypothetical protein
VKFVFKVELQHALAMQQYRDAPQLELDFSSMQAKLLVSAPWYLQQVVTIDYCSSLVNSKVSLPQSTLSF